ncbi:uncharacterized protein LOC119095315 [Pollicipes pollicipes]|uniref:uncharacterized protein LOC119095315 n=1 Tax=Pollicipes pollicipes TaxID=41117 RepID=UPI00188532DD|nr:uncharacterized protein LOC119095315 [Pollicipes pollicipes]XP_037074065.1 uncharacterized protein LOC119095315 [Pollicipes pollicipes]XP_037074066.1 uncharacterized protein LOC119095315 [Pollicipes pollicipes]XP_037074067.1 uncharacterized protein LOC119095315 [Pollicipes pollicipes]
MSMRGGGARLDSAQAAKVAVMERRVLMGCTVSVVLGLLLWVITISTEYWFSVTCAGGAAINGSNLAGVNGSSPAGVNGSSLAGVNGSAERSPDLMLLTSHTGLWRGCRDVRRNGTTASPDSAGTTRTSCRYMRVKFLPNLSDDDPRNVIIAYRRTCLGFSVISLLLLALSIFFSGYTFRVRRYTFKRVAACLHFIVAGVQLVVIEVHATSFHYQRMRMPSVVPKRCDWDYGASFVLGWICFIINMVAGVIFLYASGKKKKRPEGDQQRDQEEEDDFDDEPQIMGR